MTDTWERCSLLSALKTCRARLGRGFKREWEKEMVKIARTRESEDSLGSSNSETSQTHTTFSDRQIAHLSILEHPFEILLHLFKFARLNSTIGQQHSSKLFLCDPAIHWIIPLKLHERERERDREREREREREKEEQGEREEREREERESERERERAREREERERERGERERRARERGEREGGNDDNASEINIVLSWSISFIIHVQPNT